MPKNIQRKDYNPSDFGKKEVELHNDFTMQMEDARNYFLNVTKPRLDRSYKLYIAYTGDRQREIKSWQANIFVPYVQAVVETLMPRVLDARPEFSVIGRTAEDNIRAEKQQQLGDYYWEVSAMDRTNEDFIRSAMVYGTGFLQVSWKKDVRELSFLKSKDTTKKKLAWKKEKRTFYDGPVAEWVDNYSLWYDWHNSDRKSKQYWFKRLVLTEGEIKRRYPGADKKRLAMALDSQGGDLTDYAAIRQQVRHSNAYTDKYSTALDSDIQMHEVFEWYQPFKDFYSVIVGASNVPILKGGFMPLPFDFKESPFIELPYLKIPGEFEGYGLPMILENPQIMLNLIKNQRLDAATLNIHKMWVVNPLANINRNELVTRPFGIIYSIDPNGVKEVQFSDLKASAYKEEEMLKGDMRYSSGVDDFSMGVGGGAASATEVRHLRESTLERVRLFVNHIGDAYSDVLRYWMDMSRQLMSEKLTMRIIGDDGEAVYPLIEKDDLKGYYDYKAKVLPSIAGQQDVNKKQAMDLFQLLSQVDPQATGVDIRKLISKVITNWGWSLESISSEQQDQGDPMAVDPNDPNAQAGPGVSPGGAPPAPPAGPEAPPGIQGPQGPRAPKPQSPMQGALGMLRGPGETSGSPMSQLSSPVNLLKAQGPPPTPRGIPAGQGGIGPARKGVNSRGLNRSGNVNTNISTGNRGGSSVESNLLNRAFNIQR